MTNTGNVILPIIKKNGIGLFWRNHKIKTPLADTTAFGAEDSYLTLKSG